MDGFSEHSPSRRAQTVGPLLRWAFVAALLVTARLAECAVDSPNHSVTVTGQGVGVQQMNGGTIQMGLTHEEAVALTKASGADLVRQLTRIAERISTQIGLARDQAIALGVAEEFLAYVKGRNVPQDQWPQVFAELTRECLLTKDPERDSGGPSKAESLTAQAHDGDQESPPKEKDFPEHKPVVVRFGDIPVAMRRWVDGVIEVDSLPLSELVSELNRYTAKRIVIADQRLENMKISCAVNIRDISQTLTLLAGVMPLSVASTDDTFVLSYRLY